MKEIGEDGPVNDPKASEVDEEKPRRTPEESHEEKVKTIAAATTKILEALGEDPTR